MKASTPSGASTRRSRSRRPSAPRAPACARMVSMKHVGLNVAADPLLTLTETGVNAGLVIVSADDPSMASSQNEQDSRNYARFAKIPMLEPVGQPGGLRLRRRGLRPLGGVRHAGAAALVHQALARARPGGAARAHRAAARRVRQRHHQAPHGAAVGAPAHALRPGAARAPAGARRGVAAQRHRARHGRLRHHHVGRRLPVRQGGVPGRLGAQAGHVLAAPVAARSPSSTRRSRGSRWSRSSTRSSRRRCACWACR